MKDVLTRWRKATLALDHMLASQAWEPEPPQEFLHAFRGRPEEVPKLFTQVKGQLAVAERLMRLLACDADPRAPRLLPRFEPQPDHLLEELAQRHLTCIATLGEAPTITRVAVRSPSGARNAAAERHHALIVQQGRAKGELSSLLREPLIRLTGDNALASWVTWPLESPKHDPLGPRFELWSKGYRVDIDEDSDGLVACVSPLGA